MLPLLLMAAIHLGLNQTSKLTIDAPSYSIALRLSHLQDNLNALRVKSVDINPDTLIENPIQGFNRILISLLLGQAILLPPKSLTTPRSMFLHSPCPDSKQRRIRIPSKLIITENCIEPLKTLKKCPSLGWKSPILAPYSPPDSKAK